MGPEINVISGFRNNRGEKSADLVISEPKNDSCSILSELGLLDFWILPRTKYHMSHLPTLYVPGVITVCSSPITHKKKSQTHLLQHTTVVVRDRASSSHKRDSNSTTTIKTTTPAPHQQHSSSTSCRDSTRGGGDLTSPATVYVPDFLK